MQMDVKFGDTAHNIETVQRHLESQAKWSTDLVVFPEAALTGYCVSSREEADSIAIDRDALAPIYETCRVHNIACVVGFAEKEGGNLYNAATAIGPSGLLGHYRKIHIPCLGLDQHVQGGDDWCLFEWAGARIGILICFDLRIPEAARTLTLMGADVIALPTNWPHGAEVSAEYNTVSRAAENRIFLAACNRVGKEHGFQFFGASSIIGIDGEVLAKAGDGEEVIQADFEPERARTKRRVVIEGKYETDCVGARRPDLYRILTRP